MAQLRVQRLHGLRALRLLHGGGLVHFAHLVEEGDHHLQIAADGLRGGFIFGEALEDGPVGQPMGRAGHEGQQSRRGQGPGEPLQHVHLAFRGQLRPHQSQVAEVDPFGFREASEERAFHVGHDPSVQAQAAWRRARSSGSWKSRASTRVPLRPWWV